MHCESNPNLTPKQPLNVRDLWGEDGYIRIPRNVNAFGLTLDSAAYFSAGKIDHCSEKTCFQCTADSGCGWCSGSKSCLPGSQTGPASTETCPVDDWAYGTCTGVPCTALSCGTCLGDSGCGWCSASQTCEVGNSTLSPSDCKHGWETKEARCGTGGACSSQTTCDSCGAQQGCGWCVEGGIGGHCLPGDSKGPTSSGTTCDASMNATYYFGADNCHACKGWHWSWYQDGYACLDGWPVSMKDLSHYMLVAAGAILLFCFCRSCWRRCCRSREPEPCVVVVRRRPRVYAGVPQNAMLPSTSRGEPHLIYDGEMGDALLASAGNNELGYHGDQNGVKR